MTTLAPGIALVLDYLDGAAKDGEGGMSTGCEIHATCRALVTGQREMGIDASDTPMLQLLATLRSAVVLAGQVHAQTLTGAVWESVGEPWEDREDSADRLRMLCHLLAGTVQTAAAVGEILLCDAEAP